MKLFGLIGYPLAHSWSSGYFTAKFLQGSLSDHAYCLFEIQNVTEIHNLLTEHPELLGLNVTIPHKVSILSQLDEIDEEAGVVGAVNCIRIERHSGTIRLKGFNTDITGFEESIRPALNAGRKTALVLGTGGASRAVTYVLRKLGIGYRMVTRVPSSTGFLGYEQLTEEVMSWAGIIINCTPAGMFPDTLKAPAIPYQYINSRHLLFDLIYNPEETAFLRSGKLAGAETMNGLQMLQIQAERSWEIWKE